MLYADDLTLLTNEPRDMQIMLSRLAVYARNKHLIVNTSKSEVVHFNSAGGNVPVFDVGGATLHHKDSFRYLGMVFYRTLNMAKSADHAARPFLASAYRIRKPCRASSNCAVQQEVSLVRNAQSALITLRTVLLLQLSMLL